MSFLSQLEWRFATKAFDPTKKISDENVELILNAIRLSPSSFGLQPYHVLVITNPELRIKLREKASNQSPVTDASHLLVFCTRTDSLARIDDYINLLSRGDSDAAKKLTGYADMMKMTIQPKSPEALKTWADRQTYLALGFGLAACAELEIDSLPMEGFDPGGFDSLLELPSHLKSVVLMPIGYRAKGPDFPKTRFPKEELISRDHVK